MMLGKIVQAESSPDEKQRRTSSRLSFGRRVRRWLRDSRKKTIYIQPPAPVRLETPPIFLIGVHRSGTTLLRLILDSHSRIACPTESIFLLPLSALWRNDKAMAGLHGMGFEESHVIDKLREFSTYYFSLYAASRQKPRWADKSPHYVDCLDFIERLYGPSCQYVFIYRHGLDVACSVAERDIRQAQRYKEECGNPYAGAARYWAVQCRKMIEFQRRHSNRSFEIRYETLVENPEPTCRALFEFLNEPWEPAVLKFHEHSHTSHAGLEDRVAATSKGFVPSTKNYHKLPVDTLNRMLEEASPVLQELKYEIPEPSIIE